MIRSEAEDDASEGERVDPHGSGDGVMDQVGMLKLNREMERDLSDCRANERERRPRTADG
ncbi:hypothetical protein EBT23_06885 [bacterium]|nr:hypothetical protein [bacterium]